jgi:hypothetical protein
MCCNVEYISEYTPDRACEMSRVGTRSVHITNCVVGSVVVFYFNECICWLMY